MESWPGIPYPITKDAKGYYRIQNGLDQIKSDMLILLLTNPGERVLLPQYGTDLRSLFFDPNDPTIAERARQMIINSINTWEPRVTVDQIEVSTTIDDSALDPMDNRSEVPNILFIKISFVDPQNLSEVQELRLEVPLTGGA